MRLKQFRDARGLSQEAFAEKAGLQYKHYQAIEAGRKPKIQFPTLEKLAEACGLDLWELFHPDTAPLALGEDPPKDEETPAKPARRRRKRGS